MNTANIGVQVHFVRENRFYKLADAGRGRTTASVGDEVSFWFPHDTEHGSVGVVIKKSECNGETVYSLKKIRNRI